MLPYLDSSLSPEARARDLLSRLTLDEKIGQVKMKLFGWNCYTKTGEGEYELTDVLKFEVEKDGGLGGLYGLFRADPWSGADLSTGIPLKDAAKVYNRVQRYVIEHSRLGIPVMTAEECPHGLQGIDGVVYPVNLGAACSFDPALREENYRHIAKEIRARGGHIGLASTLDILRDGRWGRSEECYGEDPCLAGRMTGAVVRGMQGEDWRDMQRADRLMAQLKHFAAQGEAVGGHNGGATPIGERELKEIHLPAMEEGISAGVKSVMAAYPSIDGVLCHANRHLLTEILRDEMGFDGFVLSDGGGIDALCVQTGGSQKHAAALALNAGIDMALWGEAYDALPAALEDGLVDVETLDHAVLRVLIAKFRLGLFENPYVKEDAWREVDRAAARESALNMARESITLLENDGMLPLDPNRRIAVIGPNADSLYNQLGDYVSQQRIDEGVTLLAGVRGIAKNVSYAKGCSIRNPSKDGFDEALRIASEADAVILALGGSSARNFGTQIDEHGAVIVNDAMEMDCGEGVDKAELTLSGVQAELAEALSALGKPIAIVLIEGRPHSVENIRGRCNALLTAWYPGINGGQAIAEVLFGKVNPSGRLAVSIPESSAQLPCYYNRYPRYPQDYVDLRDRPAYPFGYGLSYTRFSLSDLRVESDVSLSRLRADGKMDIAVTLRNVGERAGAEVVQLYVHDEAACVLRRVWELKDFVRVTLEPGQSERVHLCLTERDLQLIDTSGNRIAEPGVFTVKVSIGSLESVTAQFSLIS